MIDCDTGAGGDGGGSEEKILKCNNNNKNGKISKYNYNNNNKNNNNNEEISNSNIIEGRDKFYVVKQFSSNIFSKFYPSEMAFVISKEEFLENVIKKADKYNQTTKIFIVFHCLNIIVILLLNVIDIFFLVIKNAALAWFVTLLIPTLIFFLTTYIINLFQQRHIRNKSKRIENYFEKLHLKYTGTSFVTLFIEDHNRRFIFGELKINLREIIIDYPYIQEVGSNGASNNIAENNYKKKDINNTNGSGISSGSGSGSGSGNNTNDIGNIAVIDIDDPIFIEPNFMKE